jgi:hypothetical protein
MFRQIIAIIRGSRSALEALRQDLYCGRVWIRIRPVWLVVGRCSQACTVGSDPVVTVEHHHVGETLLGITQLFLVDITVVSVPKLVKSLVRALITLGHVFKGTEYPLLFHMDCLGVYSVAVVVYFKIMS